MATIKYYACSTLKFFKQARRYSQALRKVAIGSVNFKDWREIFLCPIIKHLVIEPKIGKTRAIGSLTMFLTLRLTAMVKTPTKAGNSLPEPMNIAPNEHALISAIALRDPSAATELHDLRAATLYKIIYCTVRDKQIAGEVLEETLAYIFANCKDCHKQNKHLLLWKAGIARQFAGKKIGRG